MPSALKTAVKPDYTYLVGKSTTSLLVPGLPSLIWAFTESQLRDTRTSA